MDDGSDFTKDILLVPNVYNMIKISTQPCKSWFKDVILLLRYDLSLKIRSLESLDLTDVNLMK